MAIYVYKCEACDQTVELQRPMGKAPVDPPCMAPRAGKPGKHCTGTMHRDFQAEHGHRRRGALPAWVSINAGVHVEDVPRANKHYAKMDVTFDPRTGNAHVPGRNRKAFLKERGMHDLS